jgi:SAM-dependent methyltransferase
MKNTSYAQQILTPKGFTEESIFPKGFKVLHIGSGSKKLPGSQTVDILDLPGVDLVHDLDLSPWPYADNSFDLIYAHSVFEHLEDVLQTMDEMNRLLKPGGRIVLVVPYFRHPDAFVDPTHEHFFTSRSMDYFIDNGNPLASFSYTTSKFKKIDFWFGWPQTPNNPIKKLFKKYIHKHPAFYETYLSYLYPVQILVWELEAIK